MRHGDFNIGTEFYTATGRWRCTDVGTRVIVAIHLNKPDTSWYGGPPYAVAEGVFDEYDFEGCSLEPPTDTDGFSTASEPELANSAHPMPRVVSFAIVAPYTLRVAFTDGTEQSIDFRPVLEGPLFGPLQDPHVFNSVSLDTAAGTLVWPNGADFDPWVLHAWARVRGEFVARARRWASHGNQAG